MNGTDGGGRIRSPAGEPRRLQVSTGHLLKAAFRILCPPPPNKKPDLSAGKRIWEDGFVCISPLGDEIKVLPPSSQWQATVHWTVAFISFESAYKQKKDTPKGVSFFWWGRTDSNHRSYKQQIYSLSPLATRELPHVQLARLEPVDGLEPPTY